jgi:oligopeptidase A
MNQVITGDPRPDGSRGPHLGMICGNLTEPQGDSPALLNHNEVETIFHEFGHLLHGLLGEVPVKSLNGTNVAWDFVETPSQLLENWTWERASLDFFARHDQSGERIPPALYDKMIAARQFAAARMMMRQLSLGKMDLELHVNYERHKGGDLDTVARGIIADYIIPTKTEPRPLLRSFNHLFSDPTG